jgi:hypothetical protein
LPIGFEFSFEFVNEKDEIVTWSGSVQEKSLKNGVNAKLKNRTYSTKVTCNAETVTDDALFGLNILEFLLKKEIYLHGLNLLSFGYPEHLSYVNKLESLSVYIDEHRQTIATSIERLIYFYIDAILLPFKLTLKTLKKILKLNQRFVKYLANFSPIKDCRISEGYTFQISDDQLIINHILLEFYVNDTWISWGKLSDGTKRLFYIISETLNSHFPFESWLLIEEPELGIHPDQLYKLMDFLKEQSQHKQIIITTHSPDVLNILENNELHKIIVTRIDKLQGTLMHHLSPQKVKKAQSYMEDLSLKDFWVHSNLEALDEV